MRGSFAPRIITVCFNTATLFIYLPPHRFRHSSGRFCAQFSRKADEMRSEPWPRISLLDKNTLKFNAITSFNSLINMYY
ncbi:MAG: hypothetical protein LZT29_03351 [Pantoea stewartii]|nr:MAG: hypothetical protein LZT29_03351 [Pantoea stewartii]